MFIGFGFVLNCALLALICVACAYIDPLLSVGIVSIICVLWVSRFIASIFVTLCICVTVFFFIYVFVRGHPNLVAMCKARYRRLLLDLQTTHPRTHLLLVQSCDALTQSYTWLTLTFPRFNSFSLFVQSQCVAVWTLFVMHPYTNRCVEKFYKKL